MKETKLYRFLKPIIKMFTKYILKAKIIGKENIPKDGSFILAGTHTSIMDPLLLISTTKREIHFLAKIELFKGWKGLIFKNLALIPVDRKNGSPDALPTAKKVLNNKRIIGIFPEGTTNKGKEKLLPFKRGAVTMAYETNSVIIPFAIKGKYKMFSKDLQITYGKPIKIKTNNVEKENKLLKSKIKELLK